jgi:hypothetical protein
MEVEGDLRALLPDCLGEEAGPAGGVARAGRPRGEFVPELAKNRTVNRSPNDRVVTFDQRDRVAIVSQSIDPIGQFVGQIMPPVALLKPRLGRGSAISLPL